MNPPDRKTLEGLVNYIHDQMGFRFSESTRSKLLLKLKNLVLPDTWPDFSGFYASLQEGTPEARNLMARLITVNHTFFMREKNQIEDMASMVKTMGIQNPVIWSAASSSGEEAYSMAMVLWENGTRDFRIVATDINPKVLGLMHRGIYHTSHMEALSKHQRLKYFTKTDDQHWQIMPELRHRIAIKQVNLMQAPRFKQPFDFIFCRNVFIYFDEANRQKVLLTLRDNLKPGGFLYMGLTEALLRIPPGLAGTSHSRYCRTET